MTEQTSGRCVDRPPPYSVIVPVFRPGSHLTRLLASLAQQSHPPGELLVIETVARDESRRGSAAVRRQLRSFNAPNCRVRFFTVPRARFGHAATRTRAVEHSTGEFVVLLSQDVELTEHACARLLKGFVDGVGAVFGRQLAPKTAHPFDRLRRQFNYPASGQGRPSNACAAYRRSALESIGSFGEHQVHCEDVLADARLRAAGWETRYCPTAEVVHHHHPPLLERPQRYFLIGVGHRQLDLAGHPQARLGYDGLGYIRFGVSSLGRERRWHLIPRFLCESAAKWALLRGGRILPLPGSFDLPGRRQHEDRHHDLFEVEEAEED